MLLKHKICKENATISTLSSPLPSHVKINISSSVLGKQNTVSLYKLYHKAEPILSNYY